MGLWFLVEGKYFLEVGVLKDMALDLVVVGLLPDEAIFGLLFLLSVGLFF